MWHVRLTLNFIYSYFYHRPERVNLPFYAFSDASLKAGTVTRSSSIGKGFQSLQIFPPSLLQWEQKVSVRDSCFLWALSARSQEAGLLHKCLRSFEVRKEGSSVAWCFRASCCPSGLLLFGVFWQTGRWCALSAVWTQGTDVIFPFLSFPYPVCFEDALSRVVKVTRHSFELLPYSV